MDSVSPYIIIIKTLAAQYDTWVIIEEINPLISIHTVSQYDTRVIIEEINPFGCYLWFKQVIIHLLLHIEVPVPLVCVVFYVSLRGFFSYKIRN